jgi:hypothetical protein
MYSVKSIQILLANNEDSDDKSNIVDPNQNLEDNSIEVQQRLEAIHNAQQEQGQQSETSSVISEMPTQLYESQQSNNISALSTTSNDSELEIWFWDIDKNRKGGKKRRNNKNKNKNTNKYRKYRKNVTKKRKPKYSKKRKLLRLKIRRTMKKH